MRELTDEQNDWQADIRKVPRWSWCSERLLSVFGGEAIEEQLLRFGESPRKRRILDFVVIPGRVSAKVHNENGTLHRVELSVRQFSGEQWQAIFQLLSERALFLAKLLSGELPAELEAVLGELSLTLCPGSDSEIKHTVDGIHTTELTPPLAEVWRRLCERISEDPFTIFTLKGRGRDETILELRKWRMRLRGQTATPGTGRRTAPQFAPHELTPGQFWSLGGTLDDLSYSIRADELPAALLKRLDPFPVVGINDDVDAHLEEAYVRVARGAQVFGLSLRPVT